MTFSLAALEAAAQGYVTSAPAGSVWKSGSGGCVRTGYWTPALADADCDPDLVPRAAPAAPRPRGRPVAGPDRKSTRLNSSHGYISYAVFCLEKKTGPPFSA